MPEIGPRYRTYAWYGFIGATDDREDALKKLRAGFHVTERIPDETAMHGFREVPLQG